MAATLRNILIIPLLLLTMEGCSVVDSLSAYFNTYYNAQQQFAKAEEEVRAAIPLKQRENPLIHPIVLQAATKQKLTSVIEKCSKLLQYHPESNLVDDALMMIGKSYYYLADYQKAERKFKELLDGFPDSDLALESELMLARTYYRMNDKETAASTAKALIKSSQDLDVPEYGAAAANVLAQISVDAGDYLGAGPWYRQAAQFGGTSDLRAVAYRNLGEMLARVGEYGSAMDAFRKSYAESDNYISEFKAQFGVARMLTSLKRYDESLDILDALRASGNNQEFFADIDLQIGNVYRDRGDIDRAVEQYRYVDTSYARTEVSANSYYQLGLLYEQSLLEYDSARVAFNKGRGEFPTAEITKELNVRSDYQNRYANYKSEIDRYDSLRTMILAREDSAAHHDSSAAGIDSVRVVRGPTLSLDSVDAHLARNEIELAGLFYTGLNVPDSAEYWFRKLLLEHPLPEFVPRALFSLAQLNSLDSTGSGEDPDSLYRFIISEYPTTEFADASRRILGLPPDVHGRHQAESAYLDGEQLIRKRRWQDAIDTMHSVIRRFPESPFAPKAQYAIGWIYEQGPNEADSAIANYRKVVALYPSSEYAQKVRPLLEVAELEKRKAAARVDTVLTVQDSVRHSGTGRPEQAEEGRRARPEKDHREELPKP